MRHDETIEGRKRGCVYKSCHMKIILITFRSFHSHEFMLLVKNRSEKMKLLTQTAPDKNVCV